MQTTRRTLMTGTLALGAAALAPVAARAQENMQGVNPANVHRYKIGGYEVTALLDFARPTEKPETIFGTNQKPKTWRPSSRPISCPAICS